MISFRNTSGLVNTAKWPGVAISPWVRLPSAWINAGGLSGFSWRSGGEGADNIAALMALTVIAHTANQDSGVARLTYDEICGMTGLSRAKLSNGLDVLRKLCVVEQAGPKARSTYRLVNFDPRQGWAKLPAKSMYAAGSIAAFADFQLRRAAELDALKLFFLFVARRGQDTNLANISYERIEEYTAIKRAKIKTAISLRASLSLVYVEQMPRESNSHGIANAYRIVGVDSYNHRGTRGRGLDQLDLTTNPHGA